MKHIKELYNWVLSWAEKPSGPTALGLISTAEASFFPIPPDVLLIPLALGKREKAYKFALICSIGSIIGATIGYGIGSGHGGLQLAHFRISLNFFLIIYLGFLMKVSRK